MSRSGPIDQMLKALPCKNFLLSRAGHLPPVLRSRLSYRVLAAIARRAGPVPDLAPTNLGIDRRLRCRVPAEHFVARFGTPALYAGERASLELAAQLCRDADMFLDIGAHIGYFTFFVNARLPDGPPIYFFEPDPRLFALLEENVQANRLERVHGFNEAVGARDGVASFYVNHSDSLSGSLTTFFADGHAVTPVDVPVRAFATVARALQCEHACVKVDVEGAEWEFLEGAAGALDRIADLIMEVLVPAQTRGFVAELMRRGAFDAYYINDYALERSTDGSFNYRSPQYNWLFCRDSPAQLARRLGPRFRLCV